MTSCTNLLEKQFLAEKCRYWMERFNAEVPAGSLRVIVPTIEEMMIEAERAVSPPDDDEEDASERAAGVALKPCEHDGARSTTDPELSDGGRDR